MRRRVTPIAGAAALVCCFLVPDSAPAVNGETRFVNCITSRPATTGCTALPSTGPLDFAEYLVVSPDGRHAYVGVGNDAVSHFTRDPATGVLTFADCITDNSAPGCTDISGAASHPLNQLSGIAISPDGRSLYAVSSGQSSLTRFNLDPSTGALIFADCITVSGTVSGCTNISATSNSIQDARDVTVSPEGNSVYVAGGTRDAVTHFTRLSSGVVAWSGCVTAGNAPATNCGVNNVSATTNSLDTASDVIVSQDGTSVYATSTTADAVAHLTRVPSTGAISFADCITAGDTSAAGCGTSNLSATTDALSSSVEVASGPDSTSVYALGASVDSIVQLVRDAGNGKLGFGSCITAGDTPAIGCTNLSATTTALNGSQGVGAAPDGTSVYVAANGSSAVSNFARAPNGSLEYKGCLSDGVGPQQSPDCAIAVPATNSFNVIGNLTVGPEGRTVYTASGNAGAVIQLDRQLVPVCKDVSRQVADGMPTKVALTCTDENGELLTRSIVSQPAHGKLAPVDQAGGSVVYTPTPAYKGPDSFTFKAGDGRDDSAAATASLSVSPDVTPPVISNVKAKPGVFAARNTAAAKKKRKRSTTISYRLSEAAKVKFTIERPTVGRKVRGKCKARTRANARRHRCKLFKALGSLSQDGVAGSNKKKFNGKLHGRKLRKGSYRATLRATDPAGNGSKPKSVRLRIVRR